jgi:hypothetical protein
MAYSTAMTDEWWHERIRSLGISIFRGILPD